MEQSEKGQRSGAFMEEAKTYFATPGRTDDATLAEEIDFASSNPVISGLLKTISGLIVILDENRQIIALNDSLLKMLGIDDPALTLGLRLGEALECVHAHDQPAGCGTTKYCSTCGAAIAMVSCLETNEPVERICALTTLRGKQQADLALSVKAHPLWLNNKRFLLIFLQDISKEQQRAALERTFFHDISNMLFLLAGASDLLDKHEHSKLSSVLNKTTRRIVEEVAIQRYLSNTDSETYEPKLERITGEQVLDELEAFFSEHPTVENKKIQISHDNAAVSFRTDISLLLRILCNMITNGLEASGEDGLVRIWIDQEVDDSYSFNVWNAQEIPKDVARRVFQMNFSTKDQAGRGLGTYSMKLLGEKILGGEVSFTTSPDEGTIFKYVCRGNTAE